MERPGERVQVALPRQPARVLKMAARPDSSEADKVYHLPYQGGVAVQESSWEDSGWDTLAALARAREPDFPTLLDCRPCVTGGLAGQLLYRPSLPYGCRHQTERIVQVRKFSDHARAIAFAADGNTYRLAAAQSDARSECSNWLEIMLYGDAAMASEPYRGRARERDVFGLRSVGWGAGM